MAIAPTFRAYFMGLWSVLVGIFLLGAATSVVRSTREPATVASAMSPPVSLEPDLAISRFVDEILPLHRHVTFPVAHERRLVGILSLEDLKKIPREKWRGLRVRDTMRSVNPQLFVPQTATLESVDELIKHNSVGAVAVVDGSGELIGFLRQGALRKK
jgi:CBS domain-containing protein